MSDTARSPRCGICSTCHPAYPCRLECAVCWPEPALRGSDTRGTPKVAQNPNAHAGNEAQA